MWLLPAAARPLGVAAANALSQVDYSVATRVTHDVAHVIGFAYDHNMPWLARHSVALLQTFDDLGSMLIAFAVWIIYHIA